MPAVPFPTKAPNSFPRIDEISADFLCKPTENAVVEGEEGTFYGPVNKVTGLPQGYGVLDTGSWVHCSSVFNGTFSEGRRVSVNRLTKEMKLVNTKIQSDGSKLQKVESFTASGRTSGFYIDGVRVDDTIERFNLISDDQD